MAVSKFDTFVLMGFGSTLLRFHKYLVEAGLGKVITLVAPRHLTEMTSEGKMFSEHLRDSIPDYHELETLTVGSLSKGNCDLSKAVAFSFGAAWIIGADILASFKGHVYNCHGARLPQNRGGGGYSWQILQGNKYGVSLIHRIEEGLDTGPIVYAKEFIYEDCRIPLDYMKVAQHHYQEALQAFVQQLTFGIEMDRVAQPEYLSSYWPRLNAEIHGWIDWNLDGQSICRFVCAFDEPYCGAHTLLNGQTVYLKDCYFDQGDGMFHPFQAGLLYRVSTKYAAVCTKTGTLLVRKLFGSDLRLLDLTRLSVGDRFFTPVEELERARRTRVTYSATGLRNKDIIREERHDRDG